MSHSAGYLGNAAAPLALALCAACGEGEVSSASPPRADAAAVAVDAVAPPLPVPEAGPLPDDEAGTRDVAPGPGPADAEGMPMPDAADADLGAPDAAPGTPCETRIHYGDLWIRPEGRVDAVDVAPGRVTWDGRCTADAAGNSFAVLDNGWQPYFRGPSGCRIALDQHGDCGGAPPMCSTRIAYGDAWSAPEGHDARHDDVQGRVYPAGECFDAGGGLRAQGLSNLWVPHFAGDCALSFRWTQCGGLYSNPVVPFDCPDPGVLRDDARGGYVMVCTSGNAPDAFPIFESNDLTTWAPAGAVLPIAARPAWAVSDFWAPEIHRIGEAYVAYFSARTAAGHLALGAATAPTATGPYVALDRPLLEDPGMGLIDASAFVDVDGTPYLSWKEDGNAVGRPTPIRLQALTADGLAVTGPVATAITNDRRWEDNLVEGPFIVRRDGRYYLFYSGNAYFDARYALGVARAERLFGPWEKRGDPLLVSNAAWAGPGHGSVVVGPGGDDALVYHAWVGGRAGAAPGRLVLVDALRWLDGWPFIPGAPSSSSRPRP